MFALKQNSFKNMYRKKYILHEHNGIFIELYISLKPIN